MRFCGIMYCVTYFLYMYTVVRQGVLSSILFSVYVLMICLLLVIYAGSMSVGCVLYADDILLTCYRAFVMVCSLCRISTSTIQHDTIQYRISVLSFAKYIYIFFLIPKTRNTTYYVWRSCKSIGLDDRRHDRWSADMCSTFSIR